MCGTLIDGVDLGDITADCDLDSGGESGSEGVPSGVDDVEVDPVDGLALLSSDAAADDVHDHAVQSSRHVDADIASLLADAE